MGEANAGTLPKGSQDQASLIPLIYLILESEIEPWTWKLP